MTDFRSVGASGGDIAVTTDDAQAAARSQSSLLQQFNRVTTDSGDANGGAPAGAGSMGSDFFIVDYNPLGLLPDQTTTDDEDDDDLDVARSRASTRATHRSEAPEQDETLDDHTIETLSTKWKDRVRVKPTRLIRREGLQRSAVRPKRAEWVGNEHVRVRKVQASSGRRWSGEGALLGSMAGVLVGGAVALVAIATGGIGLAAGLAIVGGAALVGAVAGGFCRGPQQQKTHLDEALTSLEEEGETFTRDPARWEVGLFEHQEQALRDAVNLPGAEEEPPAGISKELWPVMLRAKRSPVAEETRLAAITARQWDDLLDVSAIAGEGAQKEQRKDLVMAAARHDYARVSRWRAYAKELRELTPQEGERLDGITDAQRKELMTVPEEQVPDPADRAVVRRSLFITAAKHGYDTAIAKKPLAIGAFNVGMMKAGPDPAAGNEPIDVHALHPRLQLDDGTNLYGHSYQQIDRFVDRLYRVGPQGAVDPQTNLSNGFLEHIGTAHLRVTLIDSNNKETALGTMKLGADDKEQGKQAVANAFKGFVGDQNGEGAAVARNLSLHVDPTGFLRPVEGPRPEEILVSEQGQPGRIKGRDHILHYTVKQTSDEGPDGYIVRSHITMPFREVEVDGRPHVMSGDSKMLITSAIRLERSDLAASKRDYAWDEPILYDISESLGDGAASADGSSRARGSDERSPSLPKLHRVVIPQRPGADPRGSRRLRPGSAGEERHVTFLDDEPELKTKLKIRVDPPPPEKKPEQPPRQHTRMRSQSVASVVDSEPPTSSSSSTRRGTTASAKASRTASRSEPPSEQQRNSVQSDGKSVEDDGTANDDA